MTAEEIAEVAGMSRAMASYCLTAWTAAMTVLERRGRLVPGLARDQVSRSRRADPPAGKPDLKPDPETAAPVVEAAAAAE